MEKFTEAFAKYIIGHKCIARAYKEPYGDYALPAEERYYGNGAEYDNGYKVFAFGGGCQGEDCNTLYLVDPQGKLIAKEDC